MKNPKNDELLLQAVNEANRYETAHLALRTITSGRPGGPDPGEEFSELRLAFEEQERARGHLAEAIEKLHVALSHETRSGKPDPADA